MIDFYIKTVASLGLLSLVMTFGTGNDAFYVGGCLLISSATIAAAIRSGRRD